MPNDRYDPQAIEPKWQRIWAESGLFRVDLHRARRPFYNLTEFPYPSAEALHVGHVYTYCGADAYGRYRRLKGDDVFQPTGFDSFGIHSENFCLRVGRHPMELTVENTARYRRQMEQLGTLFDWAHAVDTSRPDYYRWTQWLFLQLYRAGLAYRAQAPVNWCPSCLTVLANEQVIDGVCERCDATVVQREMEQWFLRITAYADRLLAGHAHADFPDRTIALQRNWIGRSEGAEIRFATVGGPDLPVFTTRPDTLFGATYLVLAPEHPEVAALTAPERAAEVRTYVHAAQAKRELERLAMAREKTGVYLGSQAINPATGERIPIWVADYVLVSYGTGAIMAVPAHDERDDAFARAHGLPMRVVIAPPGWQGEPLTEAYTGEGVLVNSGPFSGQSSEEARAAIIAWLEEGGNGKASVTYRLRDWLISRQRYWGPPIPIIYCERCGIVPVPEDDLPVRLPYVADFRPSGSGASPLAAVPSFVYTRCPRCKAPARRETDVSDTFLDSSWYYLRYPSAGRDDVPFDARLTRKWLPVSLYAGGIEHSTMHHLYARFITMALHDLGYLPFDEPFKKLRLHGLIIKDGAKMSKSRGNVVNPDEYIHRYGADALRLYLLFLGPYEEGGDFSDAGLRGATRFLQRVWDLVLQGVPPLSSEIHPSPSPLFSRGEGKAPPPTTSFSTSGAGSLVSLPFPTRGEGRVREGILQGDTSSSADPHALAPMHRTIAEVERNIEALHFHTAIAALMRYSNWLAEVRGQVAAPQWREACCTLLVLLAPFAPHIAEELWERLGEPYSVHQQRWPVYDPALLRAATVTIVIQIDGKVRDRLEAPAGLGGEQVRELALGRERVARLLHGRQVVEVIYVPDRLINLVTQ